MAKAKSPTLEAIVAAPERVSHRKLSAEQILAVLKRLEATQTFASAFVREAMRHAPEGEFERHWTRTSEALAKDGSDASHDALLTEFERARRGGDGDLRYGLKKIARYATQNQAWKNLERADRTREPRQARRHDPARPHRPHRKGQGEARLGGRQHPLGLGTSNLAQPDVKSVYEPIVSISVDRLGQTPPRFSETARNTCATQ